MRAGPTLAAGRTAAKGPWGAAAAVGVCLGRPWGRAAGGGPMGEAGPRTSCAAAVACCPAHVRKDATEDGV